MAGDVESLRSNSVTSDDREWLALQYVLGELSESDAEAFELAMLEDPRLCELVLNAGRLQSGIFAICAERSVIAEPAMGTSSVVTLRVESAVLTGRSIRAGLSRIAVSLAGLGLAGLLVAFATSSAERSGSGFTSANPETADALANLISESATSELLASQDVDAELEPGLSEVATPEWLLMAIELEDGAVESQSSDESDVY